MTRADPPADLVARVTADADRALGRSLGQVSAGAELWAALRRDDVDAAAAARFLGAAPVLAAAVMRVANSALFGYRGQVGSLQRAVTILGLDAVRGIVLAGSLRQLGRQVDPGLLDAQQWLRHSVAAAIAARRFAQGRLPQAEADSAFIAGLLHDLGWAVYASTQPRVLRACLAELAAARVEGPGACASIERAHFGMTHAECGARVAERWGLPSALCAAIGEHHPSDLAEGAITPLGETLRLADAAATERVGPLDCESGWPRPVLSEVQAGSVTDLASETDALLEALHGR